MIAVDLNAYNLLDLLLVERSEHHKELIEKVRSGIVINGRMVYGHDGNAGEPGHLVMKRKNGRMCSWEAKRNLQSDADAEH